MSPSSGPAAAIVFVGALTLATLGFFVGIAPPDPVASPLVVDQNLETPDAEDAIAAPTYREMRIAKIGPNRGWSTSIDGYARSTSLSPPPAPEALLRTEAAARRAANRAYAGAPPASPHPLGTMTDEACLACHRDGFVIGDRRAARMPHAMFTQCTQCHVEGEAPMGTGLLAKSRFVGAPSPIEGHRAGPGAPPMIPHDTFVRSDCLACHGPQGIVGLRTTHPERTSCVQCHASLPGFEATFNALQASVSSPR